MVEVILTAFNVIDMVVGVLFIVYAIVLGSELKTDGLCVWYYISSLVLGSVLLVAALISWYGMSDLHMSFLVTVSAWMTIPIAVMELVLGVICVSKKGALLDHIELHKEELHLTEAWIDRFSLYHTIVSVSLFGLCLMEIWRFMASAELRRAVLEGIAERNVYYQEEQQRMLEPP